MKKETLLNKLEAVKSRSAWSKGVKIYAAELVADIEEDDIPEDQWQLRNLLLNGAMTWKDYSWGGCSLIYDAQIAARLCTTSEFIKTHGGNRKPNKSEEWLDTQARALYQAARLIYSVIRG